MPVTVFYRLTVCLVVVASAMLLLPGSALAHAHLVRADLAPDSRLVSPGGIVHFWFDEPINAALSQIVIKDAKGQQVNSDTGSLDSANNEELDVMIPALPNGQYSVIWTSDSAQDGHVLHGFYVFTVGGAGARVVGSGSDAVATSWPTLDSTGLAVAIAHWLVLIASTLWTGALVFEFLVLRSARLHARGAVAALATGASERVIAIIQLGLLATLLASVIELEVQAYASGGSLTSFTVIRDILHSHYGAFWLVRLALLFLVQVALMLVPVTAEGKLDVNAKGWSSIVPMPAAGVFGGLYLVGLAMSGHADAVTQMVATSVLLDWLHLLANSFWIGCMASIALALVPALRSSVHESAGDGNDSRLAFLVILSRYSPLALIAVPAAMVTGIFNVQVHVSSLDAFFNSQYGRFLIAKLVIICLILAISASHVCFSRPRLVAVLAGRHSGSLAAGFASLTRRLAIEPLLGLGVLLCVALMGEVAPAVTVFSAPNQAPTVASAPAVATSTPVAQSSISGAAHMGLLDVSLAISPPAVGHARLFAIVRERGKVVTDGQVRIKLSMPGDASLGAVFSETTPSGGGYVGTGDLVQNGRWQADVMVRTHSDPLEYRDVPLQFIAGQGAGFLPPHFDPASIQIAIDPGRLSVANTLTLSNLNVPAVQILSASLDMDMGAQTVIVQSLGGGRWHASGLYAPMEGRWALTVQIEVGGAWTSVRQFVYQVPLNGPMHLLNGSKPVPSPTATPAKAKPVGYGASFAAGLPYTVIVSQMGSNGVRLLGKPILHTGTQAHGVDVMDGTPYAYVTNFGADPGTVSKIDLRTMRVVQTFEVGLGPAHIVFTADHRQAFVTDFRSNDLYVLDLTSGASSRITFPNGTCFEPHGLDLSEDGHTLYVACAGGAWIYLVSVDTKQPISPVVTAPGAFGVIVDPQRHEVWVTNQTANSISVVDEKTRTTVATFPVGKGPALPAVSPDGKTIYVADQQGNAVSVIDAARRTVTATIPVAAQPHGLDVTADGKYLYVASIGGNAVTIIRTSDDQVMAVVPSAEGANEVAISN